MINTYVAKVDGDYDEEDDELVLDDLGLALPAETTLSGEDFENLASFSDGDYVLVTAVGDGAVAATNASLYLESL